MKKLIGLVAAMFVAVSLFGQGTAMRRDANLSDVMNNSASGDQIMRHFIGMSNCVPGNAVYANGACGPDYSLHVVSGHQYFMFQTRGTAGVGNTLLLYAIDWQNQCGGDNLFVPQGGEWAFFVAGTNIVDIANPLSSAGNPVDCMVFDTTAPTASNYFGNFYGTFNGDVSKTTISNGGFVLQNNGFSTNQIIQRASIVNTNQAVHAGLISGTIGSAIFTVTANAFAGFVPGDSFTVAPGVFNEQYTIMNVLNNSTVQTFEPANRTYSNTNWFYSPVSARLADNNNNESGFIGGDGGLGLSDSGFGLAFFAHNAAFRNGWRVSNFGGGQKGDLFMQDSSTNAVPQPTVVYFHHQTFNTDRPIELMENGYVSFKQGITNSGASTIQVGANLAPQSGFQYIGNGAGLTNIPVTAVSSYYVKTNFIESRLYTNTYGVAIVVSASALLLDPNTSTGGPDMAVESPSDLVTNRAFISGTDNTGILTLNGRQYLALCVSNNGTYMFTNRSTGGGGNTASLISNSGQIFVP